MYRTRTAAFCTGLLIGALISIYLAPRILTPLPTGERVFVYGTLRSELVRFAVCHCLVPKEPATLSGYEKVSRTIVPAPRGSVAGEIITLTPAMLARIDRYEGIPDHYTRTRLTIAGAPAWVYIQNEE